MDTSEGAVDVAAEEEGEGQGGEGRSVPKVIWRKGSIAHREVVERISSGYEE